MYVLTPVRLSSNFNATRSLVRVNVAQNLFQKAKLQTMTVDPEYVPGSARPGTLLIA